MTKQEQNQCDGCQRGNEPIGGTHYLNKIGENYREMISCTKERYQEKKCGCDKNHVCVKCVCIKCGACYLEDMSCMCPLSDEQRIEDWGKEFDKIWATSDLVNIKENLKNFHYRHVCQEITKAREEGFRDAVKEINSKWLSLELRNSEPKEKWDKELSRFSIFMHQLARKEI